MNKENTLFGIVGLLFGLIVGFMFANNVNQKSAMLPVPSAVMKQNSNIPEGHPDINGSTNPAGQLIVPAAEVQAAVEKAKQEPENFQVQMKAAEVNYQTGNFDQAVVYLKQANKIKPEDYEAIVNIGNASFDGGNYTEAEKWYSSALVKKAEDVNVRTDLGLTFIFRDPPNYDRAIKEFEQVLTTEATHVQALQNLTVAYTKKGDPAKAKATLAKLESVDPTNTAVSKLRDDIQKIAAK